MPTRNCLVLTSILVSYAITSVGTTIAKPNFSGIWIRNATNSDSFTAVTGSRSELATSVNFILKIEQEGKRLVIQIEQGAQPPQVFQITQWRKKMPLGLGSKSLVMEWSGNDTLIVRRLSVFKGSYRDFGSYQVQEWVLSQGGKILTISTTAYEANRNLVTKEVFNRKQQPIVPGPAEE